MRLWKRILTLAIGLAAMSSFASAYYYWIFLGTGTGTTVPLPGRFDLNALPNNTVSYFISSRLPVGLVADDSLTAIYSQIRRAAASAPANIAEGFGRFQHADFVRFLRIAVASLDEVENHLRDGVDRGHFVNAEIEVALGTKRHAAAATIALMRYLRASKAP